MCLQTSFPSASSSIAGQVFFAFLSGAPLPDDAETCKGNGVSSSSQITKGSNGGWRESTKSSSMLLLAESEGVTEERAISSVGMLELDERLRLSDELDEVRGFL